MAFAGWIATFGYAGAAEREVNDATGLIGTFTASENLASAATTGQSAGPVDPDRGRPVVRVSVAADYWISIAPVPDTTAAVSTTKNNIRVLVRANTTETFYCNPGDKVMGTAA